MRINIEKKAKELAEFAARKRQKARDDISRVNLQRCADVVVPISVRYYSSAVSELDDAQSAINDAPSKEHAEAVYKAACDAIGSYVKTLPEDSRGIGRVWLSEIIVPEGLPSWKTRLAEIEVLETDTLPALAQKVWSHFNGTTMPDGAIDLDKITFVGLADA